MSPSRRLAAAAAHFGRDLHRCEQRVGHVLDAAARAGADLVVLPDAAFGGYLDDLRSPDPDDLPPTLSPDEPVFARLSARAGRMVVCVGYSEDAGARRYNSAVCLSGDGILGRYRKVHQPPGEALYYAAGDELPVFDTPVGRLGMLIDFDKTFPEAARSLAVQGAETIACLSAWPASLTNRAARLAYDRQSRLFDIYDSARAAENQVVWVSANQTGAHGALRFLGQAKVVSPGGEVLARTWAKAGLAVADVDIGEQVASARKVQHHLEERRPAVYRTEVAR